MKPIPIQAAVINAEGVTMRSRRITVNAYELRLYRCSPYRRTRLCGHNPYTVFRRMSGSGAPQWMRTLADAINKSKCLTTAEVNAKFDLKISANHEEW